MAGYVILVTNLLKGILFSLNFAFCSWDFSGFFDVFFFVPRVFLLNDQLIIWWVFLLSSWKNMTHDSELITREQSHRIHGTGIFTYMQTNKKSTIHVGKYTSPIKSTIHVGKYTSPMDPMGMVV